MNKYLNKQLNTMKLITLARKLDFTTETEYFDYCINSHINGNFTQCNELFKAMTKADRKQLIEYIRGCYDYEHKVLKYYINLL